MIPCSEAMISIPLYIDSELSASGMALLETHLQACHSCRNHFDQLRAVVDNIRAAAPLYEPSAASVRQVEAMVGAEARAARRWRFLMAAAAIFLALSLPLAYVLPRRASLEFANFAAAAHRRYVNGAAPLDVSTSQPELVSRWFVKRLPFQFKVPAYVNTPASPKRYSLMGARLLEYRNEDVAYLAYRMNERPISLLVSSSERIAPAGGQTFRTGGIDFHFSSERGLRLITWKDKALSYALVSDLDVTGADSCVICHGSPADRREIERLPH
ncbi:MAG: zf-HC2 domain-containing protein [Acidobacteriota bacterium]